MICRLCEEERPLAKSHIIPEGFFRQLRGEKKPPRLHTNTPGQFPKNAPIGVYDQTILCRQCERTFDAWDDHVQKVLVDDPNVVVPIDGQPAFAVNNYDYNKLKLFFISMLWRASVSTQAFYSHVHLGPHEKLARKMILEKDPGTPAVFSTVIAKFGDSKIEKTILDPHSERYDRIFYYRFFLAGFVVYIKVDSRPAPDYFEHFEVKPSPPLFIIERDFQSSAELRLILNLFRNPRG